MILVTGGAGFIGSNFILDRLAQSREPVLNLDLANGVGHPGNLAGLGGRAHERCGHADADAVARLAAPLARRARRQQVLRVRRPR